MLFNWSCNISVVFVEVGAIHLNDNVTISIDWSSCMELEWKIAAWSPEVMKQMPFYLDLHLLFLCRVLHMYCTEVCYLELELNFGCSRICTLYWSLLSWCTGHVLGLSKMARDILLLAIPISTFQNFACSLVLGMFSSACACTRQVFIPKFLRVVSLDMY